MEVIMNFLNEYGILSAIITAIASALGILAKKIYNKTIGQKISENTKKDVAELVVKYVEQVYKDIHGEEKLQKALEAFSEMLGEKGIMISDLEMRVLLEAALAEFNKAFNKAGNSADKRAELPEDLTDQLEVSEETSAERVC